MVRWRTLLLPDRWLDRRAPARRRIPSAAVYRRRARRASVKLDRLTATANNEVKRRAVVVQRYNIRLLLLLTYDFTDLFTAR